MNKILLCVVFAPLLLCNAFGQTPASPKGTRVEMPVVEMEPYIVKGDRVLPNSETWTYVKVPALILERGDRNIVSPGYEMLSNLNTSQTKVLVDELQLRQFAAAYLWPALTQALPRTPVYVVADIREQLGGSFPIIGASDTWEGDKIVATQVAPSPSNFNSHRDFAATGIYATSAAAFASEYGLSESSDINAGTDLDVDAATTTEDTQDLADLANRKIEKYARDESVIRPLGDGFVVLASNGGPLAALIRAGEPFAGSDRPSEERFAATLSYELSRYALASFPQKLPHWFVRGMSSLLGSTQVFPQRIQFALVREDLAGRSIPALSTLLKKDGAFTEEEQRMSSLFVHFGFFGDNGKYAARFMKFAGRLGNGEPPADAMFKEVFGISMRRMEARIAAYSSDMAFNKSREISGDIPRMPKAVYAQATQSEVARIKSEVYISQANPGKALEELRTAFWRGEREPAMLAMLATLELQIGTEQRGRKILKILMALPAPPPQAYIAAAQLQLKDLLAMKSAGAKLTADETSELIGILSNALAGGLKNEDLCGTLAEIVLKSITRPDSNMLAFLAEAAKRFPKNQCIADAIKAGT